MKLGHILNNLLFPRLSSYSQSIHSYVDNSDLNQQKERFKQPRSQYISKVYVAFPYTGQIEDLLERIKLSLEFDIAYELAYIFAHRVWDRGEYFIPTPDLIIPVPSDPDRTLSRGFNTAHILAQKLHSLIVQDNQDTIYSKNLLKKTRSTKQQSGMTRNERLNNIKGVFSINSKRAVNPSTIEIIWLVDDVVTTQATISECAKVLHRQFPHSSIYSINLSGN